MITRCDWSITTEPMIQYHDTEWGVPVHDNLKLFEYIILDAFQAGLSWSTILNKRENFRKAFDNFKPEFIAYYDEQKYNELITDAGIIRNKAKISAAIENAKQFLKIRDEFGSFDKYIWQFTNGKTILNSWESIKEVPPSTKISDEMSKDLKSREFKFVGTTICYAFMQAAGIVNDHLVSCFRYDYLKSIAEIY